MLMLLVQEPHLGEYITDLTEGLGYNPKNRATFLLRIKNAHSCTSLAKKNEEHIMEGTGRNKTSAGTRLDVASPNTLSDSYASRLRLNWIPLKFSY